jgi:hypothetical protein
VKDVWRAVPNRAERRRRKFRPQEKTPPPWAKADWNESTAPAAKVVPGNKE